MRMLYLFLQKSPSRAWPNSWKSSFNLFEAKKSRKVRRGTGEIAYNCNNGSNCLPVSNMVIPVAAAPGALTLAFTRVEIHDTEHQYENRQLP